MKKTKRYIFIISIFIITIIGFSMYINVKASNKLEGISSFPESYQCYLKELSKKHPNWDFKALYTNLDWNYVIDQENKFGTNLVPINYQDSWKNTTPGQYNVEVDRGWVDSSKQAVEYCMDPRNFLNEGRIFQFEALSYETSNIDGIEKILYGTEFYNTKVSYYDSIGNTISMNERYSDLILRAGQISNVSPYHLASRIKQEVGPFLSHNSINGRVEGFEGLYNFYNIGATSSAEPMGAIKNGLQYARDGKNASQATRDKYLIPWNSKEKAITGGAIFIGSSYINAGQNTIYLQKFDVNDDRNGTLFAHQYMTNVLAPYSESKSIYNGYQKSGLINNEMTFIIPVYNNMPEIPTENPNINRNEFTTDNTKMECTATNVNIRTGPSTSYDIITTIPKQTQMTRIAKGNQSGENWDKVKLENGIIGYIYQNYLIEVKEEPKPIQVTEILLDQNEIYMHIGETTQIRAVAKPQDANNKEITYASEDMDIATIDENGIIQAISQGTTSIIIASVENPDIKAECIVNIVRELEDSEIHFEEPLRVNDLEINGIEYNNNTVSDIKQKIITNLEIEITNYKNEILDDTDLIGTGSKIIVKENGRILSQYTIILYGDSDGDGKINAVDLLIIQRHILELKTMDKIFTKASNIDKNGKKPTAIDLLLIQRHILGLKTIEQ